MVSTMEVRGDGGHFYRFGKAKALRRGTIGVTLWPIYSHLELGFWPFCWHCNAHCRSDAFVGG